MSHKILIIDDDKSILQTIQIQLRQRQEYETHTADTGSEGIKMAHKIKPEVIILDILMPSENGWEIAETLKTDPNTKNIPIIVASGAGSNFDDNPYVEKELIQAYIRKPFDIIELINAIETAIEQSSPD